MEKGEIQAQPISLATIRLRRSKLSPEKIEIMLKIIIKEVKTITKTLNESEVNPFLEEYGLSPIELESLEGGHANRQITKIIDLSEEYAFF